MGSPASASYGGNPNAYIPTGSGTADYNFNNLVAPLVYQGLIGTNAIGEYTGGAGPAAANYPSAQAYVNQFLTQSPFLSEAIGGSQDVADYTARNLFGMGSGNAQSLSDAAGYGLPYAGQTLAQGFDPTYGSAVSMLQNNPYYAQAIGGAQSAADWGTAGAGVLQGGAGSIFGLGTNPMYQNITSAIESNPYYAGAQAGANTAATLGGQNAQTLQSTGHDILNAGFDPQSALFNRTQQQLLDQSNAVNSMSGVGSSPYGASVTSNALGNFDINWENNKLNRMMQAGQAATPLLEAAPALAASSAALPGQSYLSQLGSIGQGLNQQLSAGISGLNSAMPAYQAAPGLAAGSAALPGQTYTNQIGQVLNALKARNQAGIQGASAYGSLIGSAGQGFGQAQSLGGLAGQQLGTAYAAPYQAGASAASNALSGLSNLTNLGQQPYGTSQLALNNLSNYMHLGQGASQLGGNLGQLGFNQLSQGIGGGLSALNMLGGGGSGLGGLGGLIGSPATSWATDAAGNAVELGSMAATDAGGSAASGLFSLLPMLGS